MRAGKHGPPGRGKIVLNQTYFLAGLRKRRKIRTCLERITHQEKVRILWRGRGGSLGEQGKGVPREQGDVLDPIVRFLTGNNKRLEIE